MSAAPALLAIDWGTSALRGALLAADGTVLAQHAAPRGLLQVPPGGWAAAFEAEFGAWRRAHPGLPALLAGMVGSRQGWVEAPYCACPAGLAELAGQLCWLGPALADTPAGRIAIVPGLSTRAEGVPDVMRGEECQVFGALQALGLGDQDRVHLVLPGTHSKWVTVQRGRITGFATHMTGECYGLLRQQSILARMLPPDDAAAEADHPAAQAGFDDGVAAAFGAGGLLHHLFSVRSLALFGPGDDDTGPVRLAGRLSGLLVGEELRAQALAPGQPVVVVGSAALAARYRRALAQRGHPVQVAPGDAGWRGLWAVAQAAGTLAP